MSAAVRRGKAEEAEEVEGEGGMREEDDMGGAEGWRIFEFFFSIFVL